MSVNASSYDNCSKCTPDQHSINENPDLITATNLTGTSERPVPVRQVIECLNDFFKGSPEMRFCIIGELGSLNHHNGRHLYFELKDVTDGSVISCKMWEYRIAKRHLKVQELVPGQTVVAEGRFNIYKRNGKLDFDTENITPYGKGRLLEELEKLRRQLGAEGLFDCERKKPLPSFPKVVGVATSASGQAIKDIQRTLKDRAPHIKIVLAPCLCQGEHADYSIIQALSLLEKRSDIDCVIVGRGGGSQSDLQIYNSEILTRFVAAYSKPIISAVGHEGDNCLVDLAADCRASTPTRAAEEVSRCTRREYLEKLNIQQDKIMASVSRSLSYREELLTRLQKDALNTIQSYINFRLRSLYHLQDKLLILNPSRALPRKGVELKNKWLRLQTAVQTFKQQKLASLKLVRERLHRSLDKCLRTQTNQLNFLQSQLQSLSPERVLERGYSIVTSRQGRLLQPHHLKRGQEVRILFNFGWAEAKIINCDPSLSLKQVKQSSCKDSPKAAGNSSVLEQTSLFD
ncbi:MAG: exodeoxyribonuclease VII large subunit [Candidatus Bruticola sp.]